jgi:hypothetical protein
MSLPAWVNTNKKGIYMFNPSLTDLDDEITFGIGKSIADLAFKYGQSHNFQKQKFLYSHLNEQVPNNGYAKIKSSEYYDEFLDKLPPDLGDSDWEEEYLLSWKTDIPAMDVMSAEPFWQESKLLWFVVYLMPSQHGVYLIASKYWEHKSPQVSIVNFHI